MPASDPHPLETLPGVGPQVCARLEKLGVHTPLDLLFHLPIRYEDRTKITPIAELQTGITAVVIAQVEGVEVRSTRSKSLVVQIRDASGVAWLRFFHFRRVQQLAFKTGTWVQVIGEARFVTGLEFAHPEYRLSPQPPTPQLPTSLTPIYATTEGLSAKLLGNLVRQALTRHLPELVEILPEAIRAEFSLMPLAEALLATHHPSPTADTAQLLAGTHPAQQRLALEELLAHHLALRQVRHQRQTERAPCLAAPSESWARLQPQLPFDLTAAQQRVIAEMSEDLTHDYPAQRLLQGDVGCGKTIVAAALALRAIDNGYQVALMAPTELLARQHFHTFTTWLQPLDLAVTGLGGKLPAAQQRAAHAAIADGEARMVIGTHALFQTQVQFARLGLMLIDEQHRFGVGQRLALRSKGESGTLVPHQIIMSATPIPRSMAMILYADLDISTIEELPPGRHAVATVVLPDTRRGEIIDRVRALCTHRQQAYWVCPLIDESEKLQIQAATETYAHLQKQLPELTIGLVHGRLKSADKQQIMQQFQTGTIDLLVATTVIEVGVDVANAGLMIIENAERLGLAQLHQLRGRVGRGTTQATCVLMYQSPLSAVAKRRLSILRATNDGFEIAREDLAQRGPGELHGTRQTGLQPLRVADFARDRALIPTIEKIARHLQTHHPEQIPPLLARWINAVAHYEKV